MLKALNIVKRFGKSDVLKDVSLEVDKGETVSIIGPSGSGKSTFLRCLNRLETIDAGEISLDGNYLCRQTDKGVIYASERELLAITTRMGMVYQSFNLFPHLSVMRNLTIAPMRVRKKSKREAEELARAFLSKVGLSDKAEQYPYQLSGGQAQRVAIARALCMEPEIMCFDEPTSALDPELTQEVLNVMRTLAGERMTMIVVTHEMNFARSVSDRVVFMEGGAVVCQGEPERIFASDNERLARFTATAK